MNPYWTGKTVFGKLRNLEFATVEYAVTADLARQLSSAFALTITLRALGKELGHTTLDPIADGPVTLTVGEPVGYQVKGRIDKWSATDATGNPIDEADESWSTAASVSFMVVALEDTQLPVRAILAALPVIPPPLRIAAAFIGDSVRLTIGHKRPIVLPIYRDETGRPVYPPASLMVEVTESSTEAEPARKGFGAFAAAAKAALRTAKPQHTQTGTVETTATAPSRFTAEESERVVAALVKCGVSPDCLACASEDSRRPLGFMVALASGSDGLALPVIATTCRSCANIQLHAMPGLELDDIAARFETPTGSVQAPAKGN